MADTDPCTAAEEFEADVVGLAEEMSERDTAAGRGASAAYYVAVARRLLSSGDVTRATAHATEMLAVAP